MGGTRPRGRRGEPWLFLAAYVTYDGARWLFAGRPAEALAHARRIIGVERSAHIAIEGQVQHALGLGAVGGVMSNVYLAAQLVVLPLALVWPYRRRRPLYRRLRDTIVATWLIAVPIFAIFPVALGVTVAAGLRRRWGRALVLLWGPTVAVAVLATGNHYVFDIAAGLLVTGAGFAAGRLAERLVSSLPLADGTMPKSAAAR